MRGRRKGLLFKSIPLVLAVLLLAVPLLSGCKSSNKGGGGGGGGGTTPADAIVFVRGTDVWMVRPDGTGETRLTATSDKKQYPRLSPDGKTVAFTSLPASGDTLGAVVKKVDLEGMTGPDNGLETLVDGFAPCFDPTGRLFFVRTIPGLPGAVQTRFDDIFRVEDNGSDRELTDFSSVVDMGGGLAIQYLQFSPDGDKLAFMRGRRSDSRWIAVMNPDGTNIQFQDSPPVTPDTTGKGLAEGAFGLFDNNALLISHGDLQTSNSQKNHKLYRVDLTARSETVLTRGPEDLNPALSPDRSRMVFERNGQLMLADANGGNTSTLTSGTMPSWGRAVEVQSGGGGGGETSQARIAFVKDRTNVFTSNPDGSDQVQLTNNPQNAYGALAFSPNGDKLSAWLMQGDSVPTLVVMDVAGGNQTDLWGGDFRAAWTALGVTPWFGNTSWGSETVLYATGIKTVDSHLIPQVVKIDISAHQVQVIESAAQNPAASPDGAKLLYVRMPSDLAPFAGHDWGQNDFGDLVVRDLASSAVTMIQRDCFEAVYAGDGRSLAAVVWSEPDTQLKILGADGIVIRQLSMVGPGFVLGHPSFSPDGAQLVYYSGGSPGSATSISFNVMISRTQPASGETPTNFGSGQYPAWSPR